MDDQLTREAWLDEGLKQLAEAGPNALKADPLARSLGVSRGSFYWHFADVGDFRAAVLARWRSVSTDAIIAALEGEARREERLSTLMLRAFMRGDKLERAIRAWASQDSAARKAAAEVDAARVDYISRLLVEAGASTRLARSRATFLYWAYLGRLMVADGKLGALPSARLRDIARLMQAGAKES